MMQRANFIRLFAGMQHGDKDFLWVEDRVIYDAHDDFLWTDDRAIWDTEYTNAVLLHDPEKSLPVISRTVAILHVRVKELLRIIQTNDMGGLRDALNARTCVVRWEDDEGADQSRVIFPELVVGMVGSQSSNMVATVQDVLRRCLRGLSLEDGSDVLDAMHEGFILSKTPIVFELIRTVSQLTFELKDQIDDVDRHLYYTLERIAYMYTHFMCDLDAALYSIASLVRALDRQQTLDKATQSHIIGDLMRVIPITVWELISTTLVTTSIRWHHLCNSTRQKMGCCHSNPSVVFVTPYASEFIFNDKLADSVSRDANQSPHCLRLSDSSDDGKGVSYYDVLDWWSMISWRYLRRVISFGSSEAATRLIVFPARFSGLKDVIKELARPSSAPEIQYPMAISLNCAQGDGLGDMLQEFELAPFMSHSPSFHQLPTTSTAFKSFLHQPNSMSHNYVATMLSTGADPNSALRYLYIRPNVATSIVREINEALDKAMKDAADSPPSSLTEERIVYLKRCIGMFRELFVMTRSARYALHLHTVASAFIQMLSQ